MLVPSQEEDWSAWFVGGRKVRAETASSPNGPPCLPETPGVPFAWLPLSRSQVQMAVLILTYPRPHSFSQEERRVLEMFASQCGVVLENARVTLELRVAYARQ